METIQFIEKKLQAQKEYLSRQNRFFAKQLERGAKLENLISTNSELITRAQLEVEILEGLLVDIKNL